MILSLEKRGKGGGMECEIGVLEGNAGYEGVLDKLPFHGLHSSVS